MWNFDYPKHTSFFAPAHPKSETWRLVIGLFLAAGVSFFLFGLYSTGIVSTLMFLNISVEAAFSDLGRSPASLILMLLAFGMFSISVFLVVLTLHRRPIGTLFGARSRVMPQFGKTCVAMVLLLVAIFVLPPWGYAEPLIPNLAFGPWLSILPIALFAVLIQTSAEEILFRGYIQQQLAARFRSPLVWMVIPSAVFAVGHYDPVSAGENAVIVVIWAFAFGMFMADLTARSGSLGPAMAVHFINNVSAMLLVAVPGQLDGAALYVLPFGMDDVEQMRAWLPVDFVLICISWLAARLAIRA